MKPLKRLSLFSLVLLLFLVVATARGQERGRRLDRTAPERVPVVLERELLENGRLRTVIQLPAVADTYIASNRPDQNFGSDALFLGYNLGSDGFGAERLLLRFDIANNIPDNAIIHDAKLQLRLTFSSPPGDAPMGTVLRRLASSWNEFTVTWNDEPSWTPIDDVTEVGSSPDWYRWEITDVVRNWHDGLFANNGLEIIGDETVQQRERSFYARETNTDFFPQLVIDFTISNDTEPPVITVKPLPEYVRRSFTVSWEGEDVGEAGLDYYDVEVRVDGGDWEAWLTETKAAEAEFSEGEDGRFYEFRARGVDKVGNVEPFGGTEASTTVDILPPVTIINELPTIASSDNFTVSWSGSDAASGILSYDVQYQINGGPWQLWIPQTLATSAQFVAPRDGLYRFEARATDRSGLIEPFADQPEATIIVDTQAPFVTPKLWLSLISK